MFMGGQGIVVIALTFLVSGTAGAFRMYVGEARDEKIMPNVVETARFIWLALTSNAVLAGNSVEGTRRAQAARPNGSGRSWMARRAMPATIAWPDGSGTAGLAGNSIGGARRAPAGWPD